MRKPASIDEARPILEMYNSLRDEVKIHEFELCNLRMIVINLFKKSGFENLELRLNPVLERKLMLWLKSVMGPTKLEHLISLQDLLIRILWAILEGELDNRKYRIFVVFFFFSVMEKIILLSTAPIRQSEVRQIITIIPRKTNVSHY